MQTASASAASAFVLVVASPPWDLWPLSFVALVPLYVAVRSQPATSAFAVGWLTGFVFNIAACGWWVEVLDRFVELPHGGSLAIATGIWAYQGSALGLWAGLSSLLARRGRLGWLLAGPLAMALIEASFPYLFEWHLGVMWWRPWPLLQPAEFGGPTLVSALLVLANLLVADSLLALRSGRVPARAVRIGALIFLGVIGAGILRAAHVDRVRRGAPTVRVGLVQPNFGVVSLAERSRKSRRYLLALRSSTAELARQGTELVIWPETSWPLVFDRALDREYASGHPWELRSGTGVRLLFGAMTHDFGTAHVYNSAILIAESGSIAARYDKNRPIPFGEYVPFANRFPEWAERVRKRLPLFPEILPGDRPMVLADGPLRIAPLICSEDLEVDLVHRAARGANLLVTIANDAWFGDSAAPRQHLANAVLRAVESRRDFVRATNTGVSAIVDAIGRVRVEGPLFHVSGGQTMPPTLLSGEVALLEIFALGPYAAGMLPWACGAILALGIAERWLRPKRSTSSG